MEALKTNKVENEQEYLSVVISRDFTIRITTSTYSYIHIETLLLVYYIQDIAWLLYFFDNYVERKLSRYS